MEDKQYFYNIYDECRSNSVSEMQILRNRWEALNNNLRGNLPEKYNQRKDWQSAVFYNYLKVGFDVMVAKMDEIIFPAPDSFFEIVVNDIDNYDEQRIATALQRLIIFVFNNGGFWNIKRNLLKECALVGGSIVKVLHDKEKDEIKYVWMPIVKTYLDTANIGSFKESNFYGEHYEQTIGRILDDERYDKEAIKEILNYIGEGNLNKPNTTSVNDNNAEYLQAIEFDGRTHSVNPIARYPIDEFRFKYYDSKEKKEKWKIINVFRETRTILRCIDYPDGISDVVYFPLNKMMYHLFGEGVLSNALGIQSTLNDMFNMSVDNAKVSSFPMTFMEESLLASGEDMVIEPMKPIPIPDGTTGRVSPVPMAPPNYQLLIGFLNWLKESIEESIGVTRESTGGTIRSSERTAEQAQLRLNASDKRVVSFLKEFENFGVIDLLEATVKKCSMLKQTTINEYLGTETVVREGIEIDSDNIEDATDFAPFQETEEEVPVLEKSDFKKFKFNYRILGITTFAGQVELEQKIQQTIEEASTLEEGKQVVNVEELFRLLIAMRRIPSPDKYMINNKKDNINIEQEQLLGLGQEQLQNIQGEQPVDQLAMEEQDLLNQLEGEQGFE